MKTNTNELIKHCKRMVRKRNLKGAWDTWCKIFDLLRNNMEELNKAMSMFTDEEVFSICDYGKKVWKKDWGKR